MPLLLLLLLTLACLPIDWPKPMLDIGPTGSAAVTGGIVASLLIVARLFASLTVRRLVREPADRVAASRAHNLRRLAFFFLNVIGFAVALIPAGWGWTVHEILTFHERYMFGAELVVLAPYLITLIGSWAIFYDAERLLHFTGSNRVVQGQFWSRGGYVLFLLRHHVLMVFTPVLLMILQLGVLRLIPELLESIYVKLIAFLGLFGLILAIPSLVPFILGLHRMRDGRLRVQLATAAERLRVRYRDLYVWDTRGQMATAMVTGLIPRFRQIVFTDLLLSSLNDDEIEAVFGHEVGHVRHGHLLYYAVFLMLSFVTLGTAYRTVEVLSGTTLMRPDLLLVCTVLATGCYLFVVFGFVSRRCERQADVFGCKAVSCANPECDGHGPQTQLVARGGALCRAGVATFVRALERVDDINGSARNSKYNHHGGIVGRLGGLLRLVGICLATWQHSTIAKRVEFLKTLADDPRREAAFQRRVTLFRWGLLLFLAFGVLLVAYVSGWQELMEGL